MLALQQQAVRARAIIGKHAGRNFGEAALAAAVERNDLEALLCALTSRKAAESRAARRAIERNFVVPRERLWQMFVNDRREHVRVQIVGLLARGFRVQSMVSLLWVCALADGRVRDAAVRGLREWGTLWPDVPPHEDFELASALFAAHAALPDDLAAQLWAYVTWRTGLRPPRPGKASAPHAMGHAAWVRSLAVDPQPRRMLGNRVVRRRYELAPEPFAWLRAMLRR